MCRDDVWGVVVCFVVFMFLGVFLLLVGVGVVGLLDYCCVVCCVGCVYVYI